MSDDTGAITQVDATGAVEPKDEEKRTASAFDYSHIQSLICGAFDPFVSLKEKPLLPGGFLDKNGILRNDALKHDEPLLQYTSAGESVATLFQAFEYGVQRNPDAPCLGKRKSVDSPYEWVSYASVQADASKIGTFLKSLGLARGERVGLSGKNAPEYLTAIQACFGAGITTVRE